MTAKRLPEGAREVLAGEKVDGGFAAHGESTIASKVVGTWM